MVHKESIGRVVGEAGKTYKPEFTQQDDGTFELKFSAQNIDEDLDEVQYSNLIIPYIVPEVVGDYPDKKIQFKIETTNKFSVNNIEPISFSELKGDKGEDGSIAINTSYSLSELKENIDIRDIETDDYILSSGVIYITAKKNTDDDEVDEETDAYIIYENDGQRRLEQISSIINWSDYYTKIEGQALEESIQASIDARLSYIHEQQQAIYNTLGNNINITESDYTLGDNVINVMSDASVEELRQQIVEELQEYVKENDIAFDNQTGTINIKY